MKKFKGFLKTPLGVGAMIVVVGALFIGGRWIYTSVKLNNLQARLADVNARIAMATTQKGTDKESLLAERDAIVKEAEMYI